jgi:hypothetical protein
LTARVQPRERTTRALGTEDVPRGDRNAHWCGETTACTLSDDGDTCRRDPSPEVQLMSDEDMRAEIERLKQENAALKSGSGRAISMKVSEKGGLSVYGLGRFPVTLYKEQWTRLLDMSDDIRKFIVANEGKLKTRE